MFLAGCTGSSGRNFTETEDLVLSGSVGDGPIVDAEIRVEDAEGDLVYVGTSDASASYQIEVPDGTYLPVTVRVSGGTDLVTGRPADFELLGAAFDSGAITLNVSPYTTLAVKTARCMGELSPANVATAWDHIHDTLNLGWDRQTIQEPMHDPVVEHNVGTVLLSNEALGEVIRRTASALAATANPMTTDEVMNHLACDLADGSLNGLGDRIDPRATFTALATAVAVRLEVIAGTLQVDGQDAGPRLDDALVAVMPGATQSVTDVPPNQALIDQARDTLGVLHSLGLPELTDFAIALEDAGPTTARGQVLPLMTATNGNTLASLPEQVALADDLLINDLAVRQAMPAATPFISLAADDPVVSAGGSTRLSWATTDADACNASGGWTGDQPLEGSVQTAPLNEPVEYVLSCAGRGGVATARVFVDVASAPSPDPDPAPAPDPLPDPDPVPAPSPVPAISLSADQTTVDAGDTATLSWAATNAASCTASGSWSGSRSVSGTLVVGPLTADAAFTLTCTGAGGTASETTGITVLQPVPVPTVSLSAAASSVQSGEATTLSWTSSNADSCTASGAWSGSRTTSGTASTGSLTTDSTFAISCTGPGGTRSASTTVQVIQPLPPEVTLTASASQITRGDSTQLSWSASNAGSCTASGGWSGGRSSSGTQTVSPTADTTYSLTCSGPGGSDTASVAVSVNASAPTLSFSASTTALQEGESATLSWNSTDTTGCTASGSWSGNRAASGSMIVSPTSTATYNLTCTGTGGSVSDSLTIQVNATPATAPVVSIGLASSVITAGESTTLSWSATDATSCSASGAWSGSRSTSGSINVSPAASSVYSLTCSGPGGSDSASASVTVNVPLPTLTLSATPNVIDEGDTVTLTWSSTDATGCTASGGWSGNRSSNGSSTQAPVVSTTYSLICTGPGGSVSDAVTVQVNPAPADPPGLSFSSSAAAVNQGGSVTLSWTATNADGCTASGAWSGTKPASGSELVGPIDAASTFTLTCAGAGGNVVEMLTVSTIAPVALNWVAPTENVDGSPLSDLAGYRIYYGTQSRAYTDMVEVMTPGSTSHTLNLTSGDYYMAMTALDLEGNESAYSNEVLKTAP